MLKIGTGEERRGNGLLVNIQNDTEVLWVRIRND